MYNSERQTIGDVDKVAYEADLPVFFQLSRSFLSERILDQWLDELINCSPQRYDFVSPKFLQRPETSKSSP